jgi:hypothetical protein
METIFGGKSVKQLKCDLDSIYNFVFSRCTELLQDRIKAHPSFVSTRENSDPFQLLQIIRELVHAIESNAYVPMAIHDTFELIITMRQGTAMTVSQYHTHFKSMMSALTTQGGEISMHPAVKS